MVHELGSGGIADFPETRDDIVGARMKESPGEADQPFPSVGLDAGAVAGRDGDEVGVERVTDDIARVEFIGVALRREDDGGLERQEAAGGAVGGEMHVGKFFGGAIEEGLRRGGAAEELETAGRIEIFFEEADFLSGLRERRKIRAGGESFADEQERARTGRRFGSAMFQLGKRAGGDEGGVFDPIVGLRIRDDEGFKIERVQATVGQDDDTGIRRNEMGDGLNQGGVERFAVGIASFAGILGAGKAVAIGRYESGELASGGEGAKRNVFWGNHPEP